MYRITCDSKTILDTRDEQFIVKNAKVKLSDNTVGEASFTIYKQHPHYDRLAMLKSVFEISDEFGVIFRGRMTERTRDIKKGKAVDLEGSMAYFNDSIVRPYVFPNDWEDENHPEHSSYVAAVESGNVVEYYLAWLIAQHNAQVDEFQQFKLGTVTVADKNNFIERSNSEYPNTFEEIKAKLFESTLGGHLCIRYERDGNYIDYLAEYTEKNLQGITYGENLRDITQTEDGKETYSAIIPRGAEIESKESTGTIAGTETAQKRLTLADHADGDITSDIVKRGDVLYSKSAVAAYGWRFVPSSESVWDDVKEVANLLDRGVDVLEGKATSIPNTIECKAVDLHCTDAQIRSFRMYKKIPVYVAPHDINADFDITTLDIDLLNPQNTNITAGKTVLTMTAIQEKRTNEVKQLLGSLVTKTQFAEGFKETETLIEETTEQILSSVSTTYATQDFVTQEVAKIQITDDQIVAAISGTYATKDEVSDYVEGSLALKIVEEKDEGGNVINRYSQLAADVEKIVFTVGDLEIDCDQFKLDVDGKVKLAIPLANYTDAYAVINEEGIGCSKIEAGGTAVYVRPDGVYVESASPKRASKKIAFDEETLRGTLVGNWDVYGTSTTPFIIEGEDTELDEFSTRIKFSNGNILFCDPASDTSECGIYSYSDYAHLLGTWKLNNSPIVTMHDLKTLGLI